MAELTSNVHFDSVMIFFFVLAFLALLYYHIYLSSIFLGLSIAAKLFPVLFIPLIIRKLGRRQGLIYSVISGLVTIVLFAFFIDKETIFHLLKSINLFFTSFEFNASLYYVIRWAGKLLLGINIIAFAGPFLSITAIIIIFLVSRQNKKISDQQFFTKALLILTVWYLFSTIVHPWYISLPVVVSVFTSYRYTLIWSYLVTLSYSAYQTNPVNEILWFVALSYLMVITYAYLELKSEGLTRFK